MEEENQLESLREPTIKEQLKEYIKWWEKRRVIFNLFVILELIFVNPVTAGFWDYFTLKNLIIVLVSNFHYTLGWLIEYAFIKYTGSFTKIENKQFFYSLIIALLMVLNIALIPYLDLIPYFSYY